MSHLEQVEIVPRQIERFLPVVGAERIGQIQAAAESFRRALGGGTVWNVNSTAAGGGVAEMLRTLLGYARGAGIDARWAVIRGNADFFRLTKRLHHALHGSAGDGSPLGPDERRIYECVMDENAAELLAWVRRGDFVLLHDPQTAGLVGPLRRAGARVVWRCHIGSDHYDTHTDLGWSFLKPYLEEAERLIFTREAYRPPFCDPALTRVIAPSIDAFSPKNQELDLHAIRAILVHTGLVAGPNGAGAPRFEREDGSAAHVTRAAEIIRAGDAPAWETPLVVQVSRWDPLKDPVGVMMGFADHVNGAGGGAELVLAGPSVTSVSDDPEQKRVWDDVLATWEALPPAQRQRVHLVCLPMDDIDENAAIVNALQRHAAVIVQKSLQEGFGLTVTEAMWKGRPVLGSAVGGIRDQIDDGVHGVLLDDPTDLVAFGQALERLISEPESSVRLGAEARERVRERFLGVGHLLRYAEILAEMLA